MPIEWPTDTIGRRSSTNGTTHRGRTHPAKSFRAAMMRDTWNLRKGGRLGSSTGATRSINRDLDTAARRFRQEPALRRRELLEELAQKIDLDLGDVRTFLTNEGPLGFGLRNQDADALMYRFMTAWDQKDIQGVLDAMNARKRTALYLSERPDGLMDWVDKNTGVGKHLSDLSNGATVGSTDGGWGHTDEYYGRSKENRTAELFANVMSVAGEGEFSTALLKRFFPRIYSEAMLILRQHK